MFMNGFDGKNSLGNVEASHIFSQGICSHEKGHHVTPREVLHDKVEVFSILERIIQFHNTVATNFSQQVSFGSNMLDLIDI
jgi:hypothetical protein